MPPRRRGVSGYRGVHQRPNGGLYSKIRSGQLRLGLGTFETAHEAARAYDATAWPLGRPCQQMNFHDVHTRRAERLDRRRRKALALSQCDVVKNGGETIFTSDDDRWEDMWLDTSDQTSEDGDDDDDDNDWE